MPTRVMGAAPTVARPSYDCALGATGSAMEGRDDGGNPVSGTRYHPRIADSPAMTGDRWPVLRRARSSVPLWRTSAALMFVVAVAWVLLEPWLDDAPPRTSGYWVVLVVGLGLAAAGAVGMWRCATLPRADAGALTWYRGGSSKPERRAVVRALRQGRTLSPLQRPLAAAHVVGYMQLPALAWMYVGMTGLFLVLGAGSDDLMSSTILPALYALLAVANLLMLAQASRLRRAALAAGLHLEVIPPGAPVPQPAADPTA